MTVLSVARMKRLACGSDSTHRAAEGYEILEVVVEFAPIKKSEKMSVSTENAALIDRAGDIVKALGGGEPSEPAAAGHRSDSCGVGGSGRVVVTESYLIQDTLTTSFFFTVEEGRKGYKFQFMDYPPIDLAALDNAVTEIVDHASTPTIVLTQSLGIGSPVTFKSLTLTVTSAIRKNKVGETSVVSKQYEAKPGFAFLVVGMTIAQSNDVSQQDALADWGEFAMSLYCQSSVVANDNEGSSVALVGFAFAPEHFNTVSCKAGATLPLGILDPDEPEVLYLAYVVRESAKTFRLHFEEELGLPELDLAVGGAP